MREFLIESRVFEPHEPPVHHLLISSGKWALRQFKKAVCWKSRILLITHYERLKHEMRIGLRS